MATSPPHPCGYPNCPALVPRGTPRCPAHTKSARSTQSAAAHKLYDARWRAARLAFLRANPLCAECRRNGRVTPASCIDHVRPHKGDPTLFWDQSNWEALCDWRSPSTNCHGKKSSREGNAAVDR